MVLLNDIKFRIEGLEEREEENLRNINLTIIAEGEREFYLVKEILKKELLTVTLNNEGITMIVKSLSYQTPEELSSDTIIKFDVTLLEKSEEDNDLSINARLSQGIVNCRLILDALIKQLEEKELIDVEALNKDKEKIIMEDYGKYVYELLLRNDDEKDNEE